MSNDLTGILHIDTITSMETVTVTSLRPKLTPYLKSVSGSPFAVTNNDKVIAVVVDPEKYQSGRQAFVALGVDPDCPGEVEEMLKRRAEFITAMREIRSLGKQVKELVTDSDVRVFAGQMLESSAVVVDSRGLVPRVVKNRYGEESLEGLVNTIEFLSSGLGDLGD